MVRDVSLVRALNFMSVIVDKKKNNKYWRNKEDSKPFNVFLEWWLGHSLFQKGRILFRLGNNNNNFLKPCIQWNWKWPQWSTNSICTSLKSFLSMTFQCTLNTRLKKIVVVAAKSKQYFPLCATQNDSCFHTMLKVIF